MKLLGISALYHDSAAALIVDGDIIAAAGEERFSRIKNDATFPRKAIKFCLDHGGYDLSEIDAVVFYDKPLLKFERILESYYGFAPAGLRSFLTSMPIWLKDKLFFKRLIRAELSVIDPAFAASKTELLFSSHHLSHAAGAFYPSPFEEAALLTVDGVGEWATATLGHGNGKDIRLLKEIRYPHSIGLLYSAFTYYLGFKVNSDEYKLMGLAPYGDPGSPRVAQFIETIRSYLVDIKEDGSIWLDQKYFNYSSGLTMTRDKEWKKIFGLDRKNSEEELSRAHCDLAFAIQKVTEEVLLKMAAEVKRLTGSTRLCLSGGVALNCVANGEIIRKAGYDEVFVQPASGDAGGAVGAALAANHIHYRSDRITQLPDGMHGSYLGPEYSDPEILKAIRKHGLKYEHFADHEAVSKKTAGFIAEGKAVGWFQGRMEFGPRALGNRSILADARHPQMQKRLNLKIKFRESFRPFAPAVPVEDVSSYFDQEVPSPYMLTVTPVKKERRKKVPEEYLKMSLLEKLYFIRSEIPAVTHIDFSARVQTVDKETNPRFWTLLNDMRSLTGCPVVINTSFNVNNEPIVCSPEDALNCFLSTDLDVLVMGNMMIDKENLY